MRLFSGKIYCGECGTRLGSKFWHSNDKYKQVIWQCNRHCKKNSSCKNGLHLSDEELKAAVLSATNKLIEIKTKSSIPFMKLSEAFMILIPWKAKKQSWKVRWMSVPR